MRVFQMSIDRLVGDERAVLLVRRPDDQEVGALEHLVERAAAGRRR